MQTERSLPDLTRDLAGQLGDLFQNEIRLARAEAVENVKQLGGAVMRLALGIAFAAAAVTLGLLALAYALSEVIPLWAAALAAALGGVLVALVLIESGRKALSPKRLTLPRTAAQMSQDVRLIKEHVPS